MARVKRGVTSHARHKKVVKLSRGFRGRSKNCFRLALRRLEKSMQYVYRDRRIKKRDLRSLWIQRINAAARAHGLLYSSFMHGLSQSGVDLNRKMLSEIAIHNPEEFSYIVTKIKASLEGANAA